ncbi:hypothetical protein QFC22_003300 [Naganishia vaughanmartiniae]|uniref:Uncharacterized protein n=1 Tax=Naganishia vaughanmartiniae TaxID=1424756 RepID=A0ACC2X950_9TREE|nr:hypothetical protein QFC22_003300 [Naganishia vaughanmartiniae]
MSILTRAYTWRAGALLAAILIAIHLFLSVIHPTYSVYTPLYTGHRSEDPLSKSEETSRWRYEEKYQEVTGNSTGIARRKANAVFVILGERRFIHPPASSQTATDDRFITVRNSELWQIVDSMRQLEDRFNWWANYDYVFLNDEPFEEKFKTYTRKITRAHCEYGLIEPSQWKQPDWIDEEKARVAREYFFRHPLLAEYDYYWRVEPDVKFFCDLDYDPFLFMMDNKKIYGWDISIYEFDQTIPTLWDAVKDFTRQHPEYVAEDNLMEFISGDGGESYNLCHFWSNFEIADLNFWRSDAYMDFYTHLEKTGGFWYERWGDAPVHSIAAALFLPKSAVHYFKDIGYKHSSFHPHLSLLPHCSIVPKASFTRKEDAGATNRMISQMMATHVRTDTWRLWARLEHMHLVPVVLLFLRISGLSEAF